MKSKFVAILVALALLSCSKHEVTTKMSSDNTPEAESVLAEALRMMSEIYVLLPKQHQAVTLTMNLILRPKVEMPHQCT